MSERQSKNHELTTKTILSRVAERTRSKRHASRYEHVDRIGLDGASVPHNCGGQQKRRRIELKCTNRGNKNKYMDEEAMIERISEAEFKNKSTNSTSKHARTYIQGNNNEDVNCEKIDIQRIDVTRLRRKRRYPTPEYAGNCTHGIKGSKNRDMDLEKNEIERIDIKEFRSKQTNGACRRFFSHEDASQFFHEEYFNQRGHDDEDESSEEEVEIIEQAEFMKCKKHSMASKGLSTKEKSNEGNFGSTYRKGVGNISTKVPSADFGKSFLRKDTCYGSDQAGRDKSSSFLRRGNNYKDTDTKKDEIERIDEFMFRNDDFDRRGNGSSDYNYDRDNDVFDKNEGDKQQDETQTQHDLPLKFRFEEESKVVEISESENMVESMLAEFDFNCALEELGCFNSPEPEVDQENAPAEETQHARCTRGNHELVLEIDQGVFCVYCGHVHLGPKDVLPQWVGNSHCESDENQTDEFTSFAEKGKQEGTDIENHCMSKMIPSTKSTEEMRMKRGVSSYPRKEGNEDLNGCFGHAVNNSSDQCMVPESSSHPNSNLGIASRTRSKMGTVKGISEVDSDSSTEVDKSAHSHSAGIELGASPGGESDTLNASKRRRLTERKIQASNPQLSCAEVVGDGRILPKDQSQASKRCRNNPVSPPPPNDDFDRDDGHDNDNYDGGKKLRDLMAQLLKKQTGGAKGYDVCKLLSDSILEKDQMQETKKTDDPQSPNALQLRFKFEEEREETAKSEHENMVESLFEELEFCLALEEVGSFNCPEDDLENAPAEETQHERCARGKHALILEDDQGLFCVYCRHVVLGPKDVLPEWGKKNNCEPERRRWLGTEDLPDFDAFFSQPSLDNYAGLSSGISGTVWSIKPGVRESMYEHQQEGFEFLWKNLAGSINIAELKSTNPSGVGGCIISHAPGTGKTRLTIVFIETYLKMFPNCRPVIIAPASMLLTWEEEFEKWKVEFPFHNLNNLEFSGKENDTARNLLTGVKRENQDTIRMVKIYSWNKGKSILGISYSLFEKLTGEKYMTKKTNKMDSVILNKKVEALRKMLLEKPELVVLDEGHTPRNQRSNIWNALQKLKTEKRVILSGTPFQNNFAELFNTLRIVRPTVADALAQEKMFAEMITSRRVSSRKQYRGENSGSTSFAEVIDIAVEKLKISMSPFVHVHKGTILQQSLPGLRDCVVLLKPSALQKSIIERLEGLQSTFKFEHEVALTSVHPYLFQHCDSTEEQRIGINMEAVEASKLNPNEGVKTKFIIEFVHLCVAMNEKVLIFSQYIQPLELIKEQMKEVFKWTEGKQILQLQGRLDQKQRQILINLFNDPQNESKIMLASTKCCSEGISLVGASRVILLDVVWNPSVERQAICRAYRIGQKKFVHTYHLMTSGTTEADKYCRQSEKERLSELVFSSTNERYLQKHNLMGFEDRILEEMVAHEKLKEMFEKIINQPKDTNLIQSFGLTT